jgi:hypothetical protein
MNNNNNNNNNSSESKTAAITSYILELAYYSNVYESEDKNAFAFSHSTS